MPLITQILKPERFNAQEIADLMWAAGGKGTWSTFANVPFRVPVPQSLVDQVQTALNKLVEEGILGIGHQTPTEFTFQPNDQDLPITREWGPPPKIGAE